MRKAFSIIFSVLGIAFLVITYVKYGPEPETQAKEKAVQQNSTNEDVVEFWELYSKATDLRIAGDYQNAAEYYRRALQKDPNHLNAIYYLGSMELAMGNYTMAEKHWASLIEANSASARGHVQLGTLYSCRQPENSLIDLHKAAGHFSKASRLNREITGPLLQLSKIDLLNDHLNKAEERLQEVVKSNFRSLEGYFLLGYLSWKKGNKEEAGNYLDQSQKIVAGSDDKYANIGEGETDTDEDAMIEKTNRCALLSSEIQILLGRYLNDSSYSPTKVYEEFDNELSS